MENEFGKLTGRVEGDYYILIFTQNSVEFVASKRLLNTIEGQALRAFMEGF